MFGRRFFGARFFGPRFFGAGSNTAPVVTFIPALRRYTSPSRTTTLTPADRAATFTSPARDD